MRDLTESFLSSAERRQLQQCVAEAELHSAAQIVPMVATASAEYPQAEISGAMILALLLATPLSLLVFGNRLWPFLTLFGLLFGAARLLLRRWPSLRRAFVLQSHMDAEVHEAAESAFVRHGLHRTRDASGVLLYVSIFERKVVVLVDSGLRQQLPQELLRAVVAELGAAIKAGRQAAGLCRAVHQLGNKVGPRLGPNVNELQDFIVDTGPRS